METGKTMTAGSDSYLETLLETLPIPVFFKDTQGRYRGCNRAFEELTGKKRKEILGKTVFTVFPRKVARKYREMDDALFRNPGRQVYEGLVVDGKGRLRTVLFYKATLSGDGGTAGLIGAVHDITEQKKAEESLKKSEEKYRTILDSIEDGYYEVDLKGTLTAFNSGFSRMVGYTGEELKDMGYRLLVDRSSQKKISDTFGAVFRTGRSARAADWGIIRKDGTRAVIEASVSLITDEKGRPTGFRGILRDITARKETEKTLRKSREELEKHRNDLERLVHSRTVHVEETNRKHLEEIRAREKTEQTLLRRERELEEKSRFLEEANTALRVILSQQEQDQMEFQGNIVANVRELIFPYLEKLKSKRLTEDQKMYLQVVESNLKNILSPFMNHQLPNHWNFTPSEIRIANLIKQGKATKEIARILGLSERTIEAHRDRIRRKLNLRGRKVSLRAHLLSLG